MAAAGIKQDQQANNYIKGASISQIRKTEWYAYPYQTSYGDNGSETRSEAAVVADAEQFSVNATTALYLTCGPSVRQ